METINKHFQSDVRIGMAGGFCYIEKMAVDSENLTDKDHIRGALKAYRKKHSTNRWLKSTNGLGYR
jgi:hypothetical protein